MEEDAFNLDAKLSIGDGDDDRFKDEDVEEEKAPGPAAGSAKKPKKKTPIKTSNAGAQEASTADAKPIDREQQRKLQLAADQENAADLFGTRRPRRDSGRSRVQGGRAAGRPGGGAAPPDAPAPIRALRAPARRHQRGSRQIHPRGQQGVRAARHEGRHEVFNQVRGGRGGLPSDGEAAAAHRARLDEQRGREGHRELRGGAPERGAQEGEGEAGQEQKGYGRRRRRAGEGAFHRAADGCSHSPRVAPTSPCPNAAKKREQLNAGRSGGSAGLDDADHYEDYDIDDDYDFM